MRWRVVIPVFAAVLAVGVAARVMTGAPVDADVNDSGALNALKFAVVEHNKATNDLYLSQVARIIRVQKQVVAGMKYIITAELGKTPCRKGGADQECTVHEDQSKARPYQCTFTVWSKPWQSFIQLEDEKCS
ncbi:cystatin-like [Myripristis murdjan]|uniref:Zgc:163030 n=1 Tax=Myripristis murdjan TaxID=586833 RepID=A0A667YQ39_9TELE|nr:cystatin-like [Myripristis murdjan]